MISQETTNDILAEISHSLARIADKVAPRPTPDELDPFHDEGNATNHRLSQCGPHCAERLDAVDRAQFALDHSPFETDYSATD